MSAVVGIPATAAQADTVVAPLITVGSAPWSMVIDPEGTFAYVTNSGSDTVS